MGAFDQAGDIRDHDLFVVDRQNAGDPVYRPIGNDFVGSLAFQAAVELILTGDRQPNGYTEPVLTAFRRRRKVEMAIR